MTDPTPRLPRARTRRLTRLLVIGQVALVGALGIGFGAYTAAGEDTASAQAPTTPIATEPGSIAMHAGGSIPSGWLEANGQGVSKTTYPNLFAAIGYTYGGSGDTFNMPDLRGRVPAGDADMTGSYVNRMDWMASTTLGATYGAPTHTLTADQTGGRNHYHNSLHGHGSWHGHGYGTGGPCCGFGMQSGGNAWGSSTGHGHGGGTDGNWHIHDRWVDTGGAEYPWGGGWDAAQTHQNTQPTIVSYWIVKT